MPTKIEQKKLSFPEWLKLRRSMVGVTQSDIAKALGMSTQGISSWEKGTTKPALNPFQTGELCRILQVTLDELIKGFKGEAEITIS